MQRTLAHAKAAAAAGLEGVQQLVGLAQGPHPEGAQPVKRPGENVPAGMLKLTLHDVELETPSLCFCVLKIGPHWGRTATLMASPKAVWEWEVGGLLLPVLWVCSCVCAVLTVIGSSRCAWAAQSCLGT